MYLGMNQDRQLAARISQLAICDVELGRANEQVRLGRARLVLPGPTLGRP